MKWILQVVLVAISAGSGYFGAKVETSLRDARSVAAATQDVAPTVGKTADEGVPTSAPVNLVSTLTPASPVTKSYEAAENPPALPEVPALPPTVVAKGKEAAENPPALPEVTSLPPTVVAKGKETAENPPALPVVVAPLEVALDPPALPTVVAKVDQPAPKSAPTIVEERPAAPAVVVPTAPAPAVAVKEKEKEKAPTVVVAPPAPPAPAKAAEPQFKTEYRTVTETVYVEVTEAYYICRGKNRPCEERFRTVTRPQTVTRQVAVQVPVATGTTLTPADTNVVSAPAPTSTVLPSVQSPTSATPTAAAPSYGSPYASSGCSTAGSFPNQQGYSSCNSGGGNGRAAHCQPVRQVVRAVLHLGNGNGGFRANCGGGGGFLRCR